MSKLPTGYTELEYIQSSGTQYIDAGCIPTANTKVAMDFQLTAAEDAANACLFGVIGQFSFRWFGSGVVFRSNGANKADFPKGIPALDRHSVEKTATKTILDKTRSVTTTVGNVSKTLYLLAQRGNTAAQNFSRAKLYSCQIYENSALIRDFVPCKSASGVVGLYDLVDAKFYANAGSGNFAAGPEISLAPSVPPQPSGLQSIMSVALRWAASDGAETYNVYRDGAKIGSTGVTQFVDLTAGENETYTYTVTAENSGGESAGVSVTVYTKSGYFQYKPLIESANFP